MLNLNFQNKNWPINEIVVSNLELANNELKKILEGTKCERESVTFLEALQTQCFSVFNQTMTDTTIELSLTNRVRSIVCKIFFALSKTKLSKDKHTLFNLALKIYLANAATHLESGNLLLFEENFATYEQLSCEGVVDATNRFYAKILSFQVENTPTNCCDLLKAVNGLEEEDTNVPLVLHQVLNYCQDLVVRKDFATTKKIVRTLREISKHAYPAVEKRILKLELVLCYKLGSQKEMESVLVENDSVYTEATETVFRLVILTKLNFEKPTLKALFCTLFTKLLEQNATAEELAYLCKKIGKSQHKTEMTGVLLEKLSTKAYAQNRSLVKPLFAFLVEQQEDTKFALETTTKLLSVLPLACQTNAEPYVWNLCVWLFEENVQHELVEQFLGLLNDKKPQILMKVLLLMKRKNYCEASKLFAFYSDVHKDTVAHTLWAKCHLETTKDSARSVALLSYFRVLRETLSEDSLCEVVGFLEDSLCPVAEHALVSECLAQRRFESGFWNHLLVSLARTSWLFCYTGRKVLDTFFGIEPETCTATECWHALEKQRTVFCDEEKAEFGNALLTFVVNTENPFEMVLAANLALLQLGGKDNNDTVLAIVQRTLVRVSAENERDNKVWTQIVTHLLGMVMHTGNNADSFVRKDALLCFSIFVFSLSQKEAKETFENKIVLGINHLDFHFFDEVVYYLETYKFVVEKSVLLLFVNQLHCFLLKEKAKMVSEKNMEEFAKLWTSTVNGKTATLETKALLLTNCCKTLSDKTFVGLSSFLKENLKPEITFCSMTLDKYISYFECCEESNLVKELMETKIRIKGLSMTK